VAAAADRRRGGPTVTVTAAGERGLLGIAFDPDFAGNHGSQAVLLDLKCIAAAWAESRIPLAVLRRS
jgi:hypothetical protein